MRKAEKDNVVLFAEYAVVRFLKLTRDPAQQAGINVRDLLAGLLVCKTGAELHLRMADEVAHELCSGISGGPNHGCPNR